MNAQPVQAAAGGVINPFIGSWADRYEYAPEPAGGDELQSRPSGQPVDRNFPVSSNPAVRVCQLISTYVDDYYNRIHIAPQQLDLGNVVSTQTTPVFVWNAHLVPQSLEFITGLDEGILVNGQPEPPLTFAALQEREYQLSVTPDGQPNLDTVIAWDFANGEEPGVRVTGNRIIAWAFAPDWADGVLEEFDWLTDVLQSESAAEQRRELRMGPRRLFSAPMYVEDRERQLFDLQLFGWGARTWVLPIWPDAQVLLAPLAAEVLRIECDTEHLDFVVGGLAMLRGESAFAVEVVEILALDANGLDLKRATQLAWPAGTRIYPACPAQLTEQPQLARLSNTAFGTEVQFILLQDSDWPALIAADLPTYRDHLVLEVRPDETEDLTHSFQRLLATLDNKTAIPLVTDISGKAMPVTGWQWVNEGRAERAYLRSLLYTLKGQQAAMWIPTWADDLTVVGTVTDTGLTVDIANIGYARFGQGRPGRRDVRIELLDGQILYRRIDAAAEIDIETERLTINAALGVTLEPHQFARVSWMVLSRSSSDRNTIEHLADSEGVAKTAVTFQGVRDDEL